MSALSFMHRHILTANTQDPAQVEFYLPHKSVCPSCPKITPVPSNSQAAHKYWQPLTRVLTSHGHLRLNLNMPKQLRSSKLRARQILCADSGGMATQWDGNSDQRSSHIVCDQLCATLQAKANKGLQKELWTHKMEICQQGSRPNGKETASREQNKPKEKTIE